MNKNKLVTKMRYLLLLTVAFMAGCASNGEEIPLSTVVADTVAPTVSFTAPVNGQTAVPYDRKVSVAFSEAMTPSTVNSTTFTVTGPGATPVAGTVVSVGSTATFTPSANFVSGTLYTATITTGAKDLAGNALANNHVFTFTTGPAADTTRPTVKVTSPTDTAIAVPLNRKVSVGFSEVMDPLTVTTASFTLTGPGTTPVPGAVAAVGTSAVFTPSSNLAFSTLYTGTITTAVKDLAGNSMASNFEFTFTTGTLLESLAPIVVTVSPVDLAITVPTNSAVHATFNKDMDPLTISSATFTLQTSGPPLGLPAVTGVVTYNSLTKIATFTPTADLAINTKYTATITTGAKDLAGLALASNKVWSFTTAGVIVPPLDSHLGSAGTFGLMATAAITSTGNSVINGDVSLEPGTSMTGFPPAVVNGTIHVNDTVSAQARADLLIAYNYYKGLPPGAGPNAFSAGADPGALFPGGVPPGVYTSGSTIIATTPMVLDAGGNANAVWVFQIGSSLTTGANVTLTGGAQAKNVYWVPTLDATIGIGTVFNGTIVSGRDVTAVTGAKIEGRILAGATLAGTIALQNATVNVPAP